MVVGIDASRAATGKRTGTENYAYHLLRRLVPMVLDRGHGVRLYFNKASSAQLLPDDGRGEAVSIPFPRLWTHARLGFELRRRPPEVFFTPAHVIPWPYSGPSVATVHDLGYHYFPSAHPWLHRNYLRWSTRHNARRGRRVIADSQATKNDLIRLYRVEAHKIDVIYPGIDPEIRPETDRLHLQSIREKYGIEKDYLLYLGTLQPRKNLKRLVKAYLVSGVRQQLVLAGRAGWLARPLLNDLQNLPEHDRRRILLPGFIEEGDKAALISGAKAMLYPSLYEGFGFPVLEGQACETPVLCSNSSSLPEIAGEGALLVDPESDQELSEGIRRIVDDEPLRNRLRRAGAANASRFTWVSAAEQVMTTLLKAAVG